MKQIEVTDRLAYYINTQRKEDEHRNITDKTILEALVVLHYAKDLMDDAYREEIESAESAITELYFIVKQARMTEDEK